MPPKPAKPDPVEDVESSEDEAEKSADANRGPLTSTPPLLSLEQLSWRVNHSSWDGSGGGELDRGKGVILVAGHRGRDMPAECKALTKVVDAAVEGAKVADLCALGDRTIEEGAKAGETVRIELGTHIDGFIAQVAHTLVVGASKAAYLATEAVIRCYRGPERPTTRSPPPSRRFPRSSSKSFGPSRTFLETLWERIPGFARNTSTAILPRVTLPSHSAIRGPSVRSKTPCTRTHSISYEDIYLRRACTRTPRGNFEEGEVWSLDILVSTGDAKPKTLETRTTAHMGIIECSTHGLVTPYAVLHEKEGAAIAHFVFTVLMLPIGPLKITSFPWNLEVVQSEKVLKDKALVELLKQPTMTFSSSAVRALAASSPETPDRNPASTPASSPSLNLDSAALASQNPASSSLNNAAPAPASSSPHRASHEVAAATGLAAPSSPDTASSSSSYPDDLAASSSPMYDLESGFKSDPSASLSASASSKRSRKKKLTKKPMEPYGEKRRKATGEKRAAKVEREKANREKLSEAKAEGKEAKKLPTSPESSIPDHTVPNPASAPPKSTLISELDKEILELGWLIQNNRPNLGKAQPISNDSLDQPGDEDPDVLALETRAKANLSFVNHLANLLRADDVAATGFYVDTIDTMLHVVFNSTPMAVMEQRTTAFVQLLGLLRDRLEAVDGKDIATRGEVAMDAVARLRKWLHTSCDRPFMRWNSTRWGERGVQLKQAVLDPKFVNQSRSLGQLEAIQHLARMAIAFVKAKTPGAEKDFTRVPRNSRLEAPNQAMRKLLANLQVHVVPPNVVFADRCTLKELMKYFELPESPKPAQPASKTRPQPRPPVRMAPPRSQRRSRWCSSSTPSSALRRRCTGAIPPWNGSWSLFIRRLLERLPPLTHSKVYGCWRDYWECAAAVRNALFAPLHRFKAELAARLLLEEEERKAAMAKMNKQSDREGESGDDTASMDDCLTARYDARVAALL
ncbi:hypothetical protein BDK51DRAFT_34890 [Blyttiomyces helicus]|uniref:Uncharacterized protein n=1 Tax=Blyttiomyces helicus TaxID=388810 RepID=A0A4P9WHP2_9FUNG|nr:hypothetical protein BDK51DRAFT_34890 [Blyttiomyces helicus]|eukprot:RKO90948.1 hypothetical protein BDK51DRAFT_34890 [Blyttiomyces helicus]